VTGFTTVPWSHRPKLASDPVLGNNAEFECADPRTTVSRHYSMKGANRPVLRGRFERGAAVEVRGCGRRQKGNETETGGQLSRWCRGWIERRVHGRSHLMAAILKWQLPGSAVCVRNGPVVSHCHAPLNITRRNPLNDSPRIPCLLSSFVFVASFSQIRVSVCLLQRSSKSRAKRRRRSRIGIQGLCNTSNTQWHLPPTSSTRASTCEEE